MSRLKVKMNSVNRQEKTDRQAGGPLADFGSSDDGAQLLELFNIIKNKNLIAPALLMLELYRPLVGLADALMIFSEPFLKAFSLPYRLIDPLRSRDNVDLLIKQLEKCDQVASESEG